MKYNFILTSLLALSSTYAKKLKNVESPAASFKYNFMVSLQDSHFQHFCGGSLLDRWTVLTAAHCCELKPENAIVAIHRFDLSKSYREEKGEYLEVAKIIPHPKYNNQSLDNDVGVWKLKKMIPFGIDVDFVKLHKGSEKQDKDLPELEVIGWGLVDYDGDKMPNKLQHAKVKVVPSEKCLESWKHEFDSKKDICADSPDKTQSICNGDSGGPLFYTLQADPNTNNGHNNYTRFYQVGIVSFGEEKCRIEEGLPDGYTRVATFHSWILENMGSLNSKHRIRHMYNKVRSFFRGY